MTIETAILGILGIVAVLGGIGGIAAFVETLRAGGKRD